MCKTPNLLNQSDTNKTKYNYNQQQQQENWHMHKLKQIKQEPSLGTSASSSQATNWVYSADHLTNQPTNQKISFIIDLARILW